MTAFGKEHAMRFQAIICDLDGTLVDTLPGIAKAANAVLQDAGFPTHDRDAFKAFIGDGLSVMVRRALPAKATDSTMIARVAEETARTYGRDWRMGSTPYPGIFRLLTACQNSGMRLAVLTNKPDAPAREMVEALFPDHTFDSVNGAVAHTPCKPDPAGALRIAEKLGVPPGRCILLGDMAVDMLTAKAAGMTGVGALWGYQSADALIAAGADALVPTPAGLTAFIGGEP
jgi:phosphoglycolate phosphatase